MLKPTELCSKRTLERRKKAKTPFIPLPPAQSEVLNKLDTHNPVSFVEGFEPEPPALSRRLAELTLKRNLLRRFDENL